MEPGSQVPGRRDKGPNREYVEPTPASPAALAPYRARQGTPFGHGLAHPLNKQIRALVLRRGILRSSTVTRLDPRTDLRLVAEARIQGASHGQS
jgi:hypothetical protein